MDNFGYCKGIPPRCEAHTSRNPSESEVRVDPNHQGSLMRRYDAADFVPGPGPLDVVLGRGMIKYGGNHRFLGEYSMRYLDFPGRNPCADGHRCALASSCRIRDDDDCVVLTNQVAFMIFSALVKQYKDLYEKAEGGKKQICDMLVHEVCAAGGRFLKRNCCQKWEEATIEDARRKVSQSMAYIRHKTTSPMSSTVASSTKTEAAGLNETKSRERLCVPPVAGEANLDLKRPRADPGEGKCEPSTLVVQPLLAERELQPLARADTGDDADWFPDDPAWADALELADISSTFTASDSDFSVNQALLLAGEDLGQEVNSSSDHPVIPDKVFSADIAPSFNKSYPDAKKGRDPSTAVERKSPPARLVVEHHHYYIQAPTIDSLEAPSFPEPNNGLRSHVVAFLGNPSPYLHPTPARHPQGSPVLGGHPAGEGHFSFGNYNFYDPQQGEEDEHDPLN